MPNLDGVSACHLIRQFDHTPIIAMTSNIRSDDISMYFQHGTLAARRHYTYTDREIGMNDVLPKPFTRDGLLNMLEKHLGHLKQIPDGMEPMAQHPGASIPQSSAGHSLKDESSPTQSPSTISNWQSPGQFSGISPSQAAPPHQYMHPVHSGFGQEQSPVQYQVPHTEMGALRQMQHRRQILEIGSEDISNDPKRQRMYDQTNPMGMQPMARPR